MSLAPASAGITEVKKVEGGSTVYIISGQRKWVAERVDEIRAAFCPVAYGTNNRTIEDDGENIRVRVWHSNTSSLD